MARMLAADMGGTKIDFAELDLDSEGQGFSPLMEGTLESRGFASAQEAITACLEQATGPVQFLSLAVAGPVLNQQVRFTNLPWQVDGRQLKEKLGLEGVLLNNDLVALAEGVPLLGGKDRQTVKAGAGAAGGGILTVAAGTGLGVAFRGEVRHGGMVQASEAGHLSFAPRTGEEARLLAFLVGRHGHVSVEMVCSGSGVANIFAFLRDEGMDLPEELAAQVGGAAQLGPILSARVLDPSIHCPISSRTFALFFDLLAEFCGNLAVAFLPTAGIYLGGGMLLNLATLLDCHRFNDRFADRGKMSSLVEAFPIHIIKHPRATLLGAYGAGRRIFNP